MNDEKGECNKGNVMEMEGREEITDGGRKGRERKKGYGHKERGKKDRKEKDEGREGDRKQWKGTIVNSKYIFICFC